MAFDMPGTTRDAISVPFSSARQKFELIDNGLVCGKGRVFEKLSKSSK